MCPARPVVCGLIPCLFIIPCLFPRPEHNKIKNRFGDVESLAEWLSIFRAVKHNGQPIYVEHLPGPRQVGYLGKVGGRTEYPHRKYDEYLKQWYNWGGSRQQGVKEADGIRQNAGTQSALWINFGQGEDHDGCLVQHTGQAWFRNGFDVTELPVRCELRRSHLPGTGKLKKTLPATTGRKENVNKSNATFAMYRSGLLPIAVEKATDLVQFNKFMRPEKSFPACGRLPCVQNKRSR
jgi:hypothetical protein